MARKTSERAFKKIVESGLLPSARLQVYRWLYRYGPATVNEIVDSVVAALDRGATACRCTELVRQGCVEEVGTRKCEITGMNVIEYDVTDQLPDALPKQKGKKDFELKVEECCSCFLVVEDEDGGDCCFLDQALRTPLKGQHGSCPLKIRYRRLVVTA